MSDYRRLFVPGGMYFFTIVTYQRARLFETEENIGRLRTALREIRKEQPFEFVAGVILPDHVHFLWSLPPRDQDYSSRIGRMKVTFTHSLPEGMSDQILVTESRRKHREGSVWQRRFWEHTIADERDLENHLEYIHYNPVKHGLTTCPHLWPSSSFSKWVRNGLYPGDWGCCCGGRDPQLSTERFDGESWGE